MTGLEAGGPAVTLVGRAVEIARLQRIMSDARRGRLSAVVLGGAPGVGKTALLEFVSVTSPDFRTIWVGSSPRLSTVPLAGLSILIDPLTEYLEELPEPSRAAIRGVLALGPPVAGELALINAVADLLRHASRDRPLLILLDDVHHLDDGSERVFTFLSHQVQNDRIVALATTRDGVPVDTDYEWIRVEGLSVPQARTMLAQHRLKLTHDILDDLVHATAGNPLAILEAARSAEIERLVLSDHVKVPSATSARLVRAYSQQLTALTRQQWVTAVLIACAEDISIEVLGAALRADRAGTQGDAGGRAAAGPPDGAGRPGVVAAQGGAGADPAGSGPEPVGAGAGPQGPTAMAGRVAGAGSAVEDARRVRALVDELRSRGIVRLTGRSVDLRHPLIRQAVLAMAGREDLRRAHTALAAAFTEQHWPEAALWQRVAAADGPDEGLSAALRAHGQECVRRLDRARASRSFERAAELSVDRGARAELLLQAAINATHVSPRALDLLADALRESDSPELSEEIGLYRALVESWEGRAPHRVPAPPAGALAPLYAAIRAQLVLVDLRATEIRGALEQLEAMPPALAAHPVAPLVPVAHGMLRFLTGQLDREDLDRVRTAIDTHEDVQYSLAAALLLIFVRDHAGARAAISRGRQLAERSGGLAAVPWLRACEGWLEVSDGDFAAGLRSATKAAETAPVYSGRLGHALAAMVWCRATVYSGTPFETAIAAAPFPAGELPALMRVFLTQLHAIDAISHGRPEEAIKVLDPQYRRLRGQGLRGALPAAVSTDLAEALLHAGRLRDAQRAAREVLRQLGDPGDGSVPMPYPFLGSLAARCRIIAADVAQLRAISRTVLDGGGPGTENAVVNALVHLLVATRYAAEPLAPGPAPRAAVVEHARAAADSFETLGATGWGGAARRLLARAEGENQDAEARLDPWCRYGFTRRERQLVTEVLTGATTSVLAERMHLSEKTVEGYLTRIYRKAQVRSRAELMVRLQGAPAADGPPPGRH